MIPNESIIFSVIKFVSLAIFFRFFSYKFSNLDLIAYLKFISNFFVNFIVSSLGKILKDFNFGIWFETKLLFK